MHRAPTLGDPDATYAAFYADGGDQLFVAVGLYLVPFAGIAFLWHMTAMRNVLDTLTPPPSTMAHGLNLLAGIIFVTLLFAGTAAVGATAFGVYFGHTPAEDPAAARALTAARLRPGVRLRGPRGRHVRAHHHNPAAHRRGAAEDPRRRRLPARRVPAARRDQEPSRPPRLPGLGRADLGVPPAPRPPRRRARSPRPRTRHRHARDTTGPSLRSDPS